MGDYVQFSAKTKNEAITKACIELGASSDQLDIRVISEGSSGFFGIGSKPAVIEARKINEASDQDEIEKIVDSVKLNSIKEEHRRPAPRETKQNASYREKPAKEKAAKQEAPEKEKPVREKPAKEKPVREKPHRPEKTKEQEKAEKQEKPEKQDRPARPEKPVRTGKPVEVITDPALIQEIEESGRKFLADVFASMELGEVEITSRYNTSDGCLEVSFEGEDMGILIGKRGQTLDSLQYLTSLVVNKGKSNYIRVKLDTEDYRRRRKETLENLARGIAYKVKKTRKPVVLEPMNPYERRIIHSALQGNKFVETISEGEEPYRHVVVKLKRY